MVMRLAAAVVASGAVVVDQASRDAGLDEGLQCLVHRRQTDVRDLLADRCKDLLGRRVRLHRLEIGADRGTLPREATACLFQGLSQFQPVDRTGSVSWSRTLHREESYGGCPRPAIGPNSPCIGQR